MPCVTEEEACAIRARASSYFKLSLLCAIPALLIQLMGRIMDNEFIFGGGIVLLCLGCAFYALKKGRSPLWGLFGLLSCIGWAVIMVLGQRCRNCGRLGPSHPHDCDGCGAPV